MDKADQASKLREIMSDKRAERPAKLKIMSITSGKGGVGKTNFTVNFAIALSQLGKRVLVVDADFGFANIDVLLGARVKWDLSAVIRGEKCIEDILATGHGGIKFISGGAGIRELMELNTIQLNSILNKLVTLEDIADYVIFDTGAGVNYNILDVIGASNEVFLIVTPEPTSIMDAFVMTKTILQSTERPCIRLVMNKVSSPAEALHTMGNFRKVVKKHLGLELELFGYIMRDELVGEAVMLQMPFLISYPAAEASCNVRYMAEKFIESAKRDGDDGIKGFFVKLQLKKHRRQGM